MTFRLEAAITHKTMSPEDRRARNGRNPRFREKPCTDHKGKKFACFSDMARAYDIPEPLLRGRFQRGWDKELALTAPLYYRIPRRIHEDHEGRQFPTQKAMCAYWGISESLYRIRRNKGMTVKQALTAAKKVNQHDNKNLTR